MPSKRDDLDLCEFVNLPLVTLTVFCDGVYLYSELGK